MKLRLTAGLALSSALVCAYQPRVYLLPTRSMLTGKYVVSESAPPSLSLAQANKVLANHLGFDMFESIEDFGDGKEWQNMIGGGLDALLRTGDRPPRSTVMLVVHTDRPEGMMTLTAVALSFFFANLFLLRISDVLSLPNRDPLPEAPDFYVNGSLSTGDISALISTYVANAKGNFDTISSGVNWFLGSSVEYNNDVDETAEVFKVPGGAARVFLDEYMALKRYSEGHSDDYAPSDFAAFEVTSLDLLAEEYGRDSEQYQLATKIVRGWMNVVRAHCPVHSVLN